jgi:Adenylate and Guanylate cyclase catalytic domain
MCLADKGNVSCLNVSFSVCAHFSCREHAISRYALDSTLDLRRRVYCEETSLGFNSLAMYVFATFWNEQFRDTLHYSHLFSPRFLKTVNTAARMESNGEPNRIHVSQKTAELIKKAGKGYVTASTSLTSHVAPSNSFRPTHALGIG